MKERTMTDGTTWYIRLWHGISDHLDILFKRHLEARYGQTLPRQILMLDRLRHDESPSAFSCDPSS